MAPNGHLEQNGNLLSVQTLAKRVSELAEHHTGDGAPPQEELLQAIQRLQVAAEGPAHYVARKRHEVRNSVHSCSIDQS